MRIVSAIPRLRRARAAEGRPIELVPTLGALHQGHLSLLERAGAGDGALWMTLFVNPLQFGASEDLATYPRPWSAIWSWRHKPEWSWSSRRR